MMHSAKPNAPSADADEATPERGASEDNGTEENEKRSSSKFGMMSASSLKMKLNKIAQSTKDKILTSDTSSPDASDPHTTAEVDCAKGEEEANEEHTKRGSVLTRVTKGFHKIANKVNTKLKQEAHDETQHMDISAHSDPAPEAPIDMLEFESSEEVPVYSAPVTPQTEKTHHKSIRKH